MQRLKTIAYILLFIGSTILLLFCIALIFSGVGMSAMIGLTLLAVLGIVFFIVFFWLNSLKLAPNKNEYRYVKWQLFGIYVLVVPLFFFALFISPLAIQLLEESINHQKGIKLYDSFSKRKAPIKNGIVQFKYYNEEYTVPCENNEIHGKVTILYENILDHEIYFNEGQIDSTLYYHKDEMLYVYPLNDSSTLAIRRYFDNDIMKTDTTIKSQNWLWAKEWL